MNKKNFKIKIRSKNFSCKPLIDMFKSINKRVIIRFGSTTPTEILFPVGLAKKEPILEINTVEAVQNSRSKLLMKQCFANKDVNQADWCTIDMLERDNIPKYPILAKRVFGYKGKGMVKLNSQQQLEGWLDTHPNLDGWYFEQFHNYSREYRLHITKDGCFYACRKMLKSDANNRWLRNDSNSVWITEYTIEKDAENTIINYNEDIPNETFNKPVNWNTIVEHCILGLEATGLDIAAFDVKVQSSTDKNNKIRKNPKFIVLECNSAPAFGTVTLNKYYTELNKIINNYDS